MTMGEFFNKTVIQVNYWKVAIFKGGNGWLTVFLLTLFATDIDFSKMTKWQICRLFAMAFVAGAKFIDGFIDQTINNLKSAQNPLGIPDGTSGAAAVPPTVSTELASHSGDTERKVRTFG